MSRLEDDEKLPTMTLEESRDLRAYLSHLNGNPRLVLQVTPEKFEAAGLDESALEREGLAVRLANDNFWVHIYGPAKRLTELLTMLREVQAPPHPGLPPGTPRVVHLLRGRTTLCRKLGFSPPWPPGHSHVYPELYRHATCEACLRARRRES